MPTGLTPPKTVADDDWVLDFCNFTQAWSLAPPRASGKQKGEGLTVVQFDTGYTDHPELLQDSRYLIGPTHSRTFVAPGTATAPAPDGRDDLTGLFPNHGTRTAGVLLSAEGRPDPIVFPTYAATHTVHGVAPRTELIPYRVTTSVNLTDATGIGLARAIFYALAKLDTDRTLQPESPFVRIGVMSISLGRSSLGVIDNMGLITNALRAARKKGIVICAAAGQFSLPMAPAFPARDPNVICCAGCTVDHTPMPTGFLGPAVDITAPAFDVWVPGTVAGDPPQYDVVQSNGTSYATAIVAGACALWQAHHGRKWLLDPANYGPELIFTLFKTVLQSSAHKPAGWDATKRGAGVLDAEALLSAPLPPKADIQSINGGG